MDSRTDLRRNAKIAAEISEAIKLLTECGYDRARNYLKAAGVDDALAQQLLSLRYDRRSETLNRQGIGVGIFRSR